MGKEMGEISQGIAVLNQWWCPMGSTFRGGVHLEGVGAHLGRWTPTYDITFHLGLLYFKHLMLSLVPNLLGSGVLAERLGLPVRR